MLAQTDLLTYLPVVVVAAMAIGFVIANIVLSAVLGHRLPEPVEVDAPVDMDERVAHADDLRPWNLGRAAAASLRSARCRLADLEDRVHQCAR